MYNAIMDNTILKLLQETEGLMEANIIKAKLESFNIPCILQYESLGRLYGITMNGLGKVQIMVAEECFGQAQEILNTITDETEQDSDPEKESAPGKKSLEP